MTGVPPSQLLMGRNLRCKLDTWYPDIAQKVESNHSKQKKAHDGATPQRNFTVGDSVFAENFTGSPPKRLPGTVALVTGPLSYIVELESGIQVRRHVDSVRARHGPPKLNSLTPLPYRVISHPYFLLLLFLQLCRLPHPFR